MATEDVIQVQITHMQPLHLSRLGPQELVELLYGCAAEERVTVLAIADSIKRKYTVALLKKTDLDIACGKYLEQSD